MNSLTWPAIFQGLFPGLFALGSLGIVGALLVSGQEVPGEMWLTVATAVGYLFGERAPPPGTRIGGTA